jgi:hypothetical protein
MRQRAAVLIGVRRTGGLPPLQAVESGVEAIREWVEGQPGFRDDAPVFLTVGGEEVELPARVVTLTDAKKPVTAADVRRWIRAFVDLGTVEQLIVYFAGHGVNLWLGEYWLLSGAPDDPNEAVNMRASADLARYCGIPHVVFISDACRTAADSIQAHGVQGSLVFPNPGPNDQPGCVDRFWASMVGRPALEVRDANDAAARFQAIYTAALVDALRGAHADLVEPDGTVGRVRPRPLRDYLRAEVPRRLRELGAAATVSQTPDAEVVSDPPEWLAEVELPSRTRGGTRSRGIAPMAPTAGAGSDATDGSAAHDLTATAQAAFRAVLAGAPAVAPQRRVRSRSAAAPAVIESRDETLFREALARVATTPRPGHFETQCGFKVTGTTLAAVHAAGAQFDRFDDSDHAHRPDAASDAVRITHVDGRAANVLLEFADGRGALLPAIPGFVAALTYDADAGELASVEYEPSDNSTPFTANEPLIAELREVRRVVAAATALGAFRLDAGAEREALVERMRTLKGLDPSMAVYAAYALHDLQRRDEIAELESHLHQALGVRLFDVAMLARGVVRGLARGDVAPAAPHEADVYPAVPLLAQGWGLLDAYGVALAPPLEAASLRRHVTGSLWTLFDPQGVAAVRAAITSDETHR